MSRRLRAAGFAAAAAVCAGLAAAATGAPPADPSGYGPLRSVVVAAQPLAARDPLRRRAVSRLLEVRRVPDRFVPPDALVDRAQAIGRSPATPVPAGGYLLGSQLETDEAANRPPPALAGGRTPVEIAVAGAGALAARPSRRVDVVVTTETTGLRAGRTYVAAADVRLMDLRAAATPPGAEAAGGGSVDAWTATLALTRGQALRLIQAESFARSIRLLGA